MICNTCGADKTESDFYPQRRKCKTCCNAIARAHRAKPETKAKIKAHKASRRERERELNRQSRNRNREKVRAANRLYRLRNKESICQRKRELTASYGPEVVTAWNAVRREIYHGRMCAPGRCEDCGRKCRTVSHHEDYSKPLSVIWVCHQCHGLRHAGVHNAM